MSKTLIWASDMNALADFYLLLLDAREKAKGEDFREISSEFDSIIVHQIPMEFLTEDSNVGHSQIRDDAAIKPIFTVDSIPLALARIAPEQIKLNAERFSYGNHLCQDIVDLDGNVIQIQENSIS